MKNAVCVVCSGYMSYGCYIWYNVIGSTLALYGGNYTVEAVAAEAYARRTTHCEPKHCRKEEIYTGVPLLCYCYGHGTTTTTAAAAAAAATPSTVE